MLPITPTKLPGSLVQLREAARLALNHSEPMSKRRLFDSLVFVVESELPVDLQRFIQWLPAWHGMTNQTQEVWLTFYLPGSRLIRCRYQRIPNHPYWNRIPVPGTACDAHLSPQEPAEPLWSVVCPTAEGGENLTPCCTLGVALVLADRS